MHRRLRPIVCTPQLTAIPLFRVEFHGGLKTLDRDPLRSVAFGQLAIDPLPRETIRSDHLPNNLAIFRLSIALIVTFARASSRKCDMLLFTKSMSFHVDQRCSILRVHPQQREGEQLLYSLEEGETFGPASRDVCQGQRGEIRPIRLCSTMSDQVRFHEARFGFVPLTQCANRDLLFEQRPRSSG